MAAQNFLDNIHLFTQIGVFGFTDKLLVFQEFTSRKELAEKAFAAARPHQGRTAIYESVEALLAPLGTRARPGDGKVLILVSDGMDDAYLRVEKTAALARREEVRIYTILVPSATALPTAPGLVAAEDPMEEEKAAAFARLAVKTGGMHFSGIETILDFDSTLAQINDDVFGNLYSIGISGDPAPGIDPDAAAVVTTPKAKLLVSRPFTRAPGVSAPRRNSSRRSSTARSSWDRLRTRAWSGTSWAPMWTSSGPGAISRARSGCPSESRSVPTRSQGSRMETSEPSWASSASWWMRTGGRWSG